MTEIAILGDWGCKGHVVACVQNVINRVGVFFRHVEFNQLLQLMFLHNVICKAMK